MCSLILLTFNEKGEGGVGLNSFEEVRSNVAAAEGKLTLCVIGEELVEKSNSEDIVEECKTNVLRSGKPECAVLKEFTKDVAEYEKSKDTDGEAKIIVLLVKER